MGKNGNGTIIRYGIAYEDGDAKRLWIGMGGDCEGALKIALRQGSLRCVSESEERKVWVGMTEGKSRPAAPIKRGYMGQRLCVNESGACDADCAECEWHRIREEGQEFTVTFGGIF